MFCTHSLPCTGGWFRLVVLLHTKNVDGVPQYKECDRSMCPPYILHFLRSGTSVKKKQFCHHIRFLYLHPLIHLSRIVQIGLGTRLKAFY